MIQLYETYMFTAGKKFDLTQCDGFDNIFVLCSICVYTFIYLTTYIINIKLVLSYVQISVEPNERKPIYEDYA